MTLIETVEMSGLDSQAWLVDVLDCITITRSIASTNCRRRAGAQYAHNQRILLFRHVCAGRPR